MTHDEANIQRRGAELQAYYTELFQNHGEGIEHKTVLLAFRKVMAMAMAKAKAKPPLQPKTD